MRFWLSAAVVLALVAAGGALTSSSAGGASFVAAADCVGHPAFVDGDDTAVAARLPKRYTPIRDGAGGPPLVFARALHCEHATIKGETGGGGAPRNKRRRWAVRAAAR